MLSFQCGGCILPAPVLTSSNHFLSRSHNSRELPLSKFLFFFRPKLPLEGLQFQRRCERFFSPRDVKPRTASPFFPPCSLTFCVFQHLYPPQELLARRPSLGLRVLDTPFPLLFCSPFSGSMPHSGVGPFLGEILLSVVHAHWRTTSSPLFPSDSRNFLPSPSYLTTLFSPY